MNCHFFFLTFRLQKFESDSEEDDATVASPMVVKEESLASVATFNDVEMFSAEDVGNNVTICHDTDGSAVDIKTELPGDTSNIG